MLRIQHLMRIFILHFLNKSGFRRKAIKTNSQERNFLNYLILLNLHSDILKEIKLNHFHLYFVQYFIFIDPQMLTLLLWDEVEQFDVNFITDFTVSFCYLDLLL
jgi:hypothetical protein